MASANALALVAEALSVTWIVKVAFPGAVGMPPKPPFALSVIPAGSEPALIDHV